MDMAMQFNLPEQFYRYRTKWLVLGMGGSAIGGDLVGSLASTEFMCRFCGRGYNLPGFIN